jgi:hypothetical protein
MRRLGGGGRAKNEAVIEWRIGSIEKIRLRRFNGANSIHPFVAHEVHLRRPRAPAPGASRGGRPQSPTLRVPPRSHPRRQPAALEPPARLARPGPRDRHVAQHRAACLCATAGRGLRAFARGQRHLRGRDRARQLSERRPPAGRSRRRQRAGAPVEARAGAAGQRLGVTGAVGRLHAGRARRDAVSAPTVQPHPRPPVAGPGARTADLRHRGRPPRAARCHRRTPARGALGALRARPDPRHRRRAPGHRHGAAHAGRPARHGVGRGAGLLGLSQGAADGRRARAAAARRDGRRGPRCRLAAWRQGAAAHLRHALAPVPAGRGNEPGAAARTARPRARRGRLDRRGRLRQRIPLRRPSHPRHAGWRPTAP